MRNRFENALLIQQGACNPSGIALTLHEACKECLAEGVDQRTDPAIRLITHQLAFLMDVASIDRNLMEYSNLTAQCEALK
ncbi:hypothetical protein EN836_34600 [Mesorhizobium sp. M1C.F.Ca.ET.193.01.1.1]|nr:MULTISPECIES: hypothetical protein [unclassified Mesorhizobium]TGR73037.1 hypothetical protein EN836_34600 [Mesorhizobium sp. M1C.F.Ca.ET.193.01.1.1]TGT64056.1 hypothetical protein EN809_034945 [Mesorhizobium sp. M2E.F.Ca.ET.166.01.1.1]TGV97060.1 hypothetical protein EN797_035215 [Mesorhizobium sp. M2E.F.Ca.ET.154.01.1.1]